MRGSKGIKDQRIKDGLSCFVCWDLRVNKLGKDLFGFSMAKAMWLKICLPTEMISKLVSWTHKVKFVNLLLLILFSFTSFSFGKMNEDLCVNRKEMAMRKFGF